MLICDHRVHNVFIGQSSDRKRKIVEKSKKKYGQKKVYIRIRYHFQNSLLNKKNPKYYPNIDMRTIIYFCILTHRRNSFRAIKHI